MSKYKIYKDPGVACGDRILVNLNTGRVVDLLWDYNTGRAYEPRAVAQFGRALDWGSRDRRFKSGQPDH